MIIMSYIETPKEEYKKRFDLALKDITKDEFNSDEMKQLVDLLYNKLRSSDYWDRYKNDVIMGCQSLNVMRINKEVFVEFYDEDLKSHNHNLLIRLKRIHTQHSTSRTMIDNYDDYRVAVKRFNDLIMAIVRGIHKKVYTIVKPEIVKRLQRNK